MDRIDLLKLDIEGAEAQALRTAPFSLAPSTSLLSFMGIYGFEPLQRDIAPYGLVAQEGRPPDTYMVTASRPL